MQRLFQLVAVLVWFFFALGSPASAQISFIQANAAVPQSAKSVAVQFPQAQGAGNLNVVVVGASDGTAQVQAVSDSMGNTYALAVGPIVHSGGYTLSIYYAKSIKGAAPGQNTVTVTFSNTVTYPDIRIAEYSGIDPVNPIAGAVGAQGSNNSSNSGALTTTTDDVLLVAANQVETGTNSAGSGFNSRIITSPNGDILEDRVLSAAGTYSGVAPLSPGGDWIMEMVAFRGATGGSADQFTNEVVVQNLNFVPAMIFLPDGKMWVAEIGGTVRVVQPGAIQADSTPVNVLPNAVAAGDAGLLDLTLDPDFEQNNYYYVYYAQSSGGSMRDKVSRFTATPDWIGTVGGSELVVWQDDPDNSVGHHGAALGFGPDGKLYISTGEHDNASNAQSLTTYRGKVLRVNSDGTIPSDNPFADGAGQNKDEIWALGLRNPFRFSFDEVTGQMYLGDVGGNDHTTAVEEINLIVRGGNYGWPQCEGPCGVAGIIDPIYSYAHEGRDAGVMGGFVYRGSQFPSTYQGNYFFADYAQNWIKRLTLDPTGTVVTGAYPFLPVDGSLDSPEIGDPVQLREGPDGSIYYLDLSFAESEEAFNDGSLRKISYVSNGNSPPSVSMTATPTTGPVPLLVNFSSAGTSDPDGDPLTYNWDFGDGNTATAPNPIYTYQQSGQYLVTLTVTDGVAQSFDTLTVKVGNPPEGTILSPTDNSTFRAGDTIFISGDASDSEDGVLPDSAFSWTVVFLHEGHVHPAVGPVAGVRSMTFNVPVSGHDFQGNTRYEILLTVTDSDGLTQTSSAFIFPVKVNLSVDTVPSGLTVQVDGISKTTPFVFDTAERFQHAFTAPNQTIGLSQYEFESWSDGGAQSHQIIVPDQDASFTATYNEITPTVNPGLLAAYSFNEGSGTTAADSSGNNLSGSIVGATWTSGKYGGGLLFNGSSSYVDLGNPAALQFTGSMTIEAWVNAAANPDDDGQIVAKSNGTGWQFKTSPDTGPHTFGLGVSPGSGAITQRYSSTTRALGTWYHVAGVYDATAGTLSTYVNGVLDNGSLSGTIPTSQFNQNVNVNIGRRTGGFYFDGVIDEVRIYGRALSQAEILFDMNTPIGGAPSDTTPPTVSITSPTTGADVNGIVTVTATAIDDVAMTGVQFLLDGANLGAEVTGPGPVYTFNWDTATVSNGPHTLSAHARDAVNNTATAADVNLTVSNPDTNPPTVTVTSPAAGADVSGTVTVTASASDDLAMAGVQFLLDGANLGAEVSGAGPVFSFNWDTTTASNGAHTLSARARDTSNNTTISVAVNLTVTNTDTTGPRSRLHRRQRAPTSAAR